MELYPGTNVKMTQSQLNWAYVKANKKVSNLIRQLLEELVETDELLQYGTTQNLDKNRPMLKKAIIGNYFATHLCNGVNIKVRISFVNVDFLLLLCT